MAAYIYRIVAKPLRAVGPDGRVVEAHPLRFLYKEGCAGRGEIMQAGKADAYWKRRGGAALIAVGDSTNDEAVPVYYNHYENRGCVVDDWFGYRAGDIVGDRFHPWWSMVVPHHIYDGFRSTVRDLVGQQPFGCTPDTSLLPPQWGKGNLMRGITVMQGRDANLQVALTLLFGDQVIKPPVPEAA